MRQSSVSHQLGSVWCEELVILPYEDSRLIDPDGKDEKNTVLLKDLVPFLRRHRPSTSAPVMDITGLHEEIARALGAVSKPSSGPRRFGIYESVEALAEAGSDAADDADRVSVYRAVRPDQPNTGTYLVQVHTVDPLLPEEEHTRAREKIGNPLQALNKLPPSRNIVPCVDVVPLDDETGYAVVLKDVQAEALRVRMSAGGDRPVLGADAKRRVVSGVLSGLAVAHGYRVVHRHITPDTVLVARNGTAMITGFDYAHTGQPRVGTVAINAYERHEAAYLAPECLAGPQGFSKDVGHVRGGGPLP
ncbi:protein kinase domain-containing protein [Streptomyces sp. CS62]|uniref:protein kinase domain-containing protein n=1 Tax=Streptomyces sp. CS62 TaxID=3119268 RepID=UPI002F95432D